MGRGGFAQAIDRRSFDNEQAGYESFDTNVAGIVGDGVPNSGFPMKTVSTADFGPRELSKVMTCSTLGVAF